MFLLVNLCSVFEAELQDVIPICHATIAGTRIVGRLTAGLVPPLSFTLHYTPLFLLLKELFFSFFH